MKQIIWSLFLLSLVAIQTIIFPFFSIWGYTPDLLTFSLILLALQLGKKQGLCLGFLLGIFQDILVGSFFGVNVFLKMGIGYFIGSLESRFFKEHFFLPMICFVFAKLLQDGLWFFIFKSFFSWEWDQMLLNFRFYWISYVYTILISSFLYRYLNKITFFIDKKLY